MHYVPESAREFLQDSAAEDGADREARSFHFRSAPVYLLTAFVGSLLAADLLIGFLAELGQNELLTYRVIVGYRLALFAALLGGSRILYQTLDGLTQGKVGADLALTIACLAAIILKEPVTAALVVFVALCGESIEGYTIDRAQHAIRRVFQICPKIAHVIRDNRELDVAVSELEVGETVIVRPGERVPVDGVIVDGTSAIDESALTGESLPVDKATGDHVFSGSINQFGSLTMTAEKVGEDTTLAQIVKLVGDATARKAPLERTADRLARLFLPVVLTVALATLVGWRIQSGEWTPGFMPALSVLVVACPCPLILATPSAVMAAMAWLARTGVVVKGSVALERLAQIDTLAFDKTGTLTRGKLEVAAIHPFADLDEIDLLRTASIAEKRSEHPIGRVIVREAEARGCVIPGVYEFAARPGFGIAVQVEGGSLGDHIAKLVRAETESLELVVGNRRLLDQSNVQFSDAAVEQIEQIEESGQTVIMVGLQGRLLGVIGVRDTVRSESRSIVAELQVAGIEHITMLTGDRLAPARQVAEQVGLGNAVHPEMLPADKADWINDQTKQGRSVAMVGDGVNDAPALANAAIGIALGGVGSDIASEAGDLVLMGDPLRPLPGLLRLSRKLVQNIRQSIYIFAFGMNALGMILGAVGILSPVAAAVFHEAASLAVMINALRLLWFERFDTTWLGQLLQRTTSTRDRMLDWLSPTEWVFRLLRHWSTLLRLAGAAAIMLWLLSGVTLIENHEQAVVTRFGRCHATLDGGLHWRWPTPFERLRIEEIDRVRSVPIGFRGAMPKAPTDDVISPAIEWTSEHADSIEVVSAESLALTGEEVLVDFTGEVHYRISDLYQFAFTAAAPDETVRAVAESTIRQAAAQLSLDNILTAQRARVEEQCLQETQTAIAAYDLGIEVTDLHLLDIHPPKQVVPDYRRVADALEEREQLVNQAEAYYAREVLNAAGEDAIRLLSDSVADVRQQVNASTTGEVRGWELDDDLWNKLNNKTGDRQLLSGEAAKTLYEAEQRRVERIEAAKGQALRFNKLLSVFRSRPDLTANHLYWQSIDRSLSKRPLTIVDPKVTGKQHLLLADPLLMSGPSLLRSTSGVGSSNETAPEGLRRIAPGFSQGENAQREQSPNGANNEADLGN